MEVKEKVQSHPNVKGYFKELPFYSRLIKKPRVNPIKP